MTDGTAKVVGEEKNFYGGLMQQQQLLLSLGE
jgi:hypothetical protein